MKCPEESTNVEIQQVFAKIKKIPRISEAIRKKKKFGKTKKYSYNSIFSGIMNYRKKTVDLFTINFT